MVYNVSCLGKLLSTLKSKGLEGVIIGSTAYLLRRGLKEFEDDVDLFLTSLSPTYDEDKIVGIANELGCFLGQTEWNTPQLRCVINECEIIVDLYENMYDFYIPTEMLEDSEEVRVGGFEAKLIKLEDYLILKAKSGREEDLEDLNKISSDVKDGKVKIDRNAIIKRLNLFEDYERNLIIKRLKSAGISL